MTLFVIRPNISVERSNSILGRLSKFPHDSPIPLSANPVSSPTPLLSIFLARAPRSLSRPASAADSGLSSFDGRTRRPNVLMDANNHPEQEQLTTAPKDEPVGFDPSRMIGIIKRKALIKDLAAAYHAECLTYCQELLQLQRKWEEQQYAERKIPEDSRKQIMRPSKRPKKGL